jgi:superfamily II DNA/RNA helicase
MLEQFNKYVHCSATLVIGAVPIVKQEVELRKHPVIIIAISGRLVDLLKNSYSIDLQKYHDV